MRLKSWVWLLVWLLGTLTTQGEVKTNLQPEYPRDELPKGFCIWAHAESLDALVRHTKATLLFTDWDGQNALMWTGKMASGKRFFRFATAVLYAPVAGKKEWVVTAADASDWIIGAPILPRITITTQGKPKGFNSVGVSTWWQVVASDAQHGTVYEVEYYHQLMGEAARGSRLVVWEDGQGKWRLVSLLLGNYWADTGWMDDTKVETTWTNRANEPVVLTETVIGVQHGAAVALQWCSQRSYAGQLPLRKARHERYYVKVLKGNTFSGIVKQMVEDDGCGDRGIARKVVGSLSKEIRQMNVGLDIGHLAVGQEIAIPDGERRRAIKDARAGQK